MVGLCFKIHNLDRRCTGSKLEEDPEKPEEKGVTKKAKGVKKRVVKNDINFEDSKECINRSARQYCPLNVTIGREDRLTSVT